MSEIFKSEAFVLYGIPLLIALARIVDVSIGTLRIIFIAKGLRLWAPILGFFEVSIWLGAISQVMENLTKHDQLFCLRAWFLGNYIGMYIENRLALGMVVVRIITKVDSSELIRALRAMRSSVTVADAQGNTGAVKIIFTVIKRSDIAHVRELILKYNPQAVYLIEDVRHASDPAVSEPLPKRSFGSFWRGLRK